MDFLHNHEQNENKQCTPEEEYKQELNTKYDRFKSDRSIQFYDELFELIYDGYVSPNNWESVITNLRNEYKSKIETEEIKLAKQIINWTQIPDADFSSVVDKVKSNVSENKYHVSDLLQGNLNHILETYQIHNKPANSLNEIFIDKVGDDNES